MRPTGVVSDLETLIQGYSSYMLSIGRSPATAKLYARDVRAWSEWFKRPPEFFREDEWDDWTESLAARGNSGKTIQRYQSGVRRFFKYLRRRKLLTHDPSKDSEAVKTSRKLPEILSQAEAETMLSLASGRNRVMVELLYACGLRNTEVRTLQVIDHRGDHLRVTGKNKKTRKVPLQPRSRELLEAWIGNRTGLVFQEEKGASITDRQLRRIVRRLAKAAGFKHRITPHTLRHSIATHLYERGAPLESIQDFLGHEHIETTRIYVRIASDRMFSRVNAAHPLASVSSVPGTPAS